jgi:hypothetical protein
MNDTERQLMIYRILNGKIKCKTRFGTFILKHPTIEDKYEAERVYEETYTEALTEGAKCEEEFEEFLENKAIWNPVLQAKFDKLSKDLEELKVTLCNTYINSNSRLTIKEAIRKTKLELDRLHTRHHEYDYVSANGLALLQKARYLTAMSVYTIDGKKMFESETYWTSNPAIVDELNNDASKYKITEAQFRELARTEPWRSIWFCKKATGDRVFPCSAIELTDEQKALVYWTQVYDNIYEHPNCPPEELINDDDALDGWFIIQKRKRSKETDKEWLESHITNPDIKNSGDVFVVVGKDDELRKRVYAANDPAAKAQQKTLMKKVEEHGVLEVVNQPDAIIKKQQMIAKAYSDRVKGKG